MILQFKQPTNEKGDTARQILFNGHPGFWFCDCHPNKPLLIGEKCILCLRRGND